MSFDSLKEDTGVRLRLDPRTKFLIFCVSSIFSLVSFKILPLLMYGTLLCFLIALCGAPFQSLRIALILYVLLYIRFVLEISNAGALELTMLIQGIVSIVLFVFPIFLSFILLTKTTRISQFLSALQAMRLPQGAVIAIAVLFRFIPTVKEEWTGVKKAMAFRGISLEPIAILRSPLKTVEYGIIPLLFSSVSVMEEMAASALARGIDSEKKRTSYESVKLCFPDYLVMILAVLILALGAVSGKLEVIL